MFARWNEEIIKGIGEAMDLLSLHLYMPGWSPVALARRQFVGGLLCHRRGGADAGRADPIDRGDGGPTSR